MEFAVHLELFTKIKEGMQWSHRKNLQYWKTLTFSFCFVLCFLFFFYLLIYTVQSILLFLTLFTLFLLFLNPYRSTQALGPVYQEQIAKSSQTQSYWVSLVSLKTLISCHVPTHTLFFLNANNPHCEDVILWFARWSTLELLAPLKRTRGKWLDKINNIEWSFELLLILLLWL